MKSGNKSSVVIQGPSIGFCGLLTLIFITLKLTHVIDWSWWWVTVPLWGPFALLFGIATLIGLGIFAFNIRSLRK